MSQVVARSSMKPGTLGRPVSVTTNSYEITHLPQATFYHYDGNSARSATIYQTLIRSPSQLTSVASVIRPKAINPKRPDGRVIARVAVEVMEEVQKTNAAVFHRATPVFDGKKNLFSPGELRFRGGHDSTIYTIDMVKNRTDTSSDKGVYTVELRRVGIIEPRDLQNVLNGSPHSDKSLTAIQMLNLVLRQAAILNHKVHDRRSIYTKNHMRTLGHLEIWRGYFQSVRPSLGRMLVNIDTSAALMYPEGQLVNLVQTFLKEREIRSLQRLGLDPAAPNWRSLKAFLSGLRVCVGKSRSGTDRIRTIDKLIPNAGQHTFEKDNEPITVQKYYRLFKNYDLKFPGLPGICTKRGDVIPMELCYVPPHQIYRRVLRDADSSSQMLRFSTLKPNERRDQIREGYKVLNYRESPFVRNAGMQISGSLLDVNGRILQPPRLVYGGNREITVNDGKWDLRGLHFNNPATIKAWAIISFEPRKDIRDIQRFCFDLVKCMRALGMIVPMEQPPIFQAAGQADVANAMLDAGKRSMQAYTEFLKHNRQPAVQEPPSIIIVVLPDSAAEIRKLVKQWGDMTQDTPTQCVRSMKLPGNNQYHNNLAMKHVPINVKVGGVNAVVNSPALRSFMGDGGMIIGADVSHPGPGVIRPSVAGVVSTRGSSAAKYVARCSAQEPRVEVITELKKLIRTAIMDNNPPRRILFFRDGISEGEFDNVAAVEFRDIKDAAKEAWKLGKLTTPLPTVTYVAVGKRHHVRFFPHEGQADRSGNCLPGLVVDTGITSPVVFDYFLQAHSGLQGTSRPSHYIVIRDENTFTADLLQEISYALCHSYARATRSVSIPAPVYYADLVCSRADIHFQNWLNYSDDNSTESGTFNIEKWRKGFGMAKQKQQGNMYFM
ncbi:Piwi-domain-containing protein [Rickenella mellea]|uniref:Piwi-domain-containing protein n=1 Tax=Rickenella mellea TaxID=50990 RepID=A0A4Y7QAE0_9AGAM|nr:Piwi-domain-containing protein [Rickenella mellea]